MAHIRSHHELRNLERRRPLLLSRSPLLSLLAMTSLRLPEARRPARQTPALRLVPARSALQKNCTSEPPPDRRGRAGVTLHAYIFPNLLRRLEAIPASFSNLYFRGESRSASRWSRRDARPRGYEPCRFQSSSGHRGRNPAAAATARGQELPGPPSVQRASRKERRPKPRHETPLR